jgi:hypothetical protein
MRKSAAVVLIGTSPIEVPWVGATASTLRMYFGAPRFVFTVTFLRELLKPQSRLVTEFVTGPIKSTPAVTDAEPSVIETAPPLICRMFTVATVTVTL